MAEEPRAIRPVKVMLDKERTILYDFNAIVDLEKVMGRSLLQATSWDFSTLSTSDLRAFVWAGLLHEDETLTQRDVGRMLTFANLVAIMDAVMAGWGVSMPESDAKGTETQDAPKEQNGSTSGLSDGKTLALANASSGA